MKTHALLPAVIVLFVISLAIVTPARAADDENTVKVFILAGQSNMEGKAKNKLLEHQATDPKTKDFSSIGCGGTWMCFLKNAAASR